MQILRTRGIHFPPVSNTWFYLNEEDLKMMTIYRSTERDRLFDWFSGVCEKHFVFDMTGNIGGDAAGFAYEFPNKTILTCELNPDKAKALKCNCERFRNITVFCGDSTILLKAFRNKDTETINQFRIGGNHVDVDITDMIILLDPPFNLVEEYSKDKVACKLGFDNHELVEYCQENFKGIPSVIKVPNNWNYSANVGVFKKIYTKHSNIVFCFFDEKFESLN